MELRLPTAVGAIDDEHLAAHLGRVRVGVGLRAGLRAGLRVGVAVGLRVAPTCGMTVSS